MIRRTLVLLTAIMIFATVAEAQRPVRRPLERAQRWEFSIQTRYTWGKTFDGDDGTYVKIQEDLGWGFGFGYNLSQHFNLGMVFTWRSVPYESRGQSEEDPEEYSTISGSMDASTFGLTADWNILKGKFTPYVNGGLGWMHVNSNIFAGWTSGCWWYPYWGYVCGPVPLTYGANLTVYNLGIGGRFEVTDSVYLRGGYEKGWNSSDSVDGTDIMRIDIGFMF